MGVSKRCGLGRFDMVLAQREQVHVQIEQQAALFVAAHHALNSEDARQPLAPCDGLHLVQAGAGVHHRVASGQLCSPWVSSTTSSPPSQPAGPFRKRVQETSVRARWPPCSPRTALSVWLPSAFLFPLQRLMPSGKTLSGSTAEKKCGLWSSPCSTRARMVGAAPQSCGSCWVFLASRAWVPALSRPSVHGALPSAQCPMAQCACLRSQVVGIEDIGHGQQHGNCFVGVVRKRQKAAPRIWRGTRPEDGCIRKSSWR